MMYLIAQKILEEAPKEIAKAMAKRVAFSVAVSMGLEVVKEGLDHWQNMPSLEDEVEDNTSTPQVTIKARFGKIARVGVAQTSGSTVYEVLKHTTKWGGPACMGAGVLTTLFMQKILDPEASLDDLKDPLKPLPRNEVVVEDDDKCSKP